MKPSLHTQDAFTQSLNSECLTLCLCWKLTRMDERIYGLTDHDQPILSEGVLYQPTAALTAGSFTQGLSLKPGRGAASGVLSSDLITQTDLLAGVWDRCRVDIYRCDWQHPEQGFIPHWQGYLSEISASPSGEFEAELISLKVDLETSVGRLVTRTCDAELGDARCGVRADNRQCDQRFETCRDVFANTLNYRGFPHLPGTDFILRGPQMGNNDGGKR